MAHSPVCQPNQRARFSGRPENGAGRWPHLPSSPSSGLIYLDADGVAILHPPDRQWACGISREGPILGADFLKKPPRLGDARGQRAAVRQVGLGTAVARVETRTAVQNVSPAATEQSVVVAASVEPVAAAPSLDRVVIAAAVVFAFVG